MCVCVSHILVLFVIAIFRISPLLCTLRVWRHFRLLSILAYGCLCFAIFLPLSSMSRSFRAFWMMSKKNSLQMCHVKPTVNNKVASKFLRIFSLPSSMYIFAKKEHVFLQFFIRLGLSLFLSSGLKFRNCRSHTHSLIHFTLCIRWNNRLPKANRIDSRYELCVSDCMQNIVKIESFVVCLPVMRAFRFMPLIQVFRQMSHDAHIQFQKLRNIWVNFSSEMVLRKECFEEDHKRISPISMEWNIGAICQKCATQASDKKDYKVQAVAQNHIRIWKILFRIWKIFVYEKYGWMARK